jgi:hypothetical protein
MAVWVINLCPGVGLPPALNFDWENSMRLTSLFHRRGFLAVALAAGAYPAIAAEPSNRNRNNQTDRQRRPARRPLRGIVRMSDATPTHFERMVGQRFVFRNPNDRSQRFTLVLKEVERIPLSENDPRNSRRQRWTRGGHRIRRDPYWLVFAARRGSNLSEGTYDVVNSSLGRYTGYLSPSSREARSRGQECYTMLYA